MVVFQVMLVLAHGAAASDVPAARASAPDASHAVAVVAVADDVHSAVLRDAAGHLQRYAVGATVAPQWRVANVASGEVTLRYAGNFRGRALEMRLHAGDSTDLDAQAAALERSEQPIAVPSARAARAKPAARHPTEPSH